MTEGYLFTSKNITLVVTVIVIIKSSNSIPISDSGEEDNQGTLNSLSAVCHSCILKTIIKYNTTKLSILCWTEYFKCLITNKGCHQFNLLFRRSMCEVRSFFNNLLRFLVSNITDRWRCVAQSVRTCKQAHTNGWILTQLLTFILFSCLNITKW